MASKALQLAPSKLPVAVAADGLQAYLQQIGTVPLLSAEEEIALATRYREQGDLRAAEQLVLSHLRYVARIARGYSGYGLAEADLIQEGTIGLMKAVKRFDPSVGVRLVSFAVHWIKSEIHDFVISNWRIVKVATTKSQRKLFFNLRKAKKRLGWFSRSEVEAVAADLGVPPSEVLEMEARLYARDDCFEAPDNDEEATQTFAPVQYLQAPHDSDPAHSLDQANWTANREDKLANALKTLDPRSLEIVSKRWLGEEKTGLKVLAEKYAVSIERIRQLELAAIKQLRDVMAVSAA